MSHGPRLQRTAASQGGFQDWVDRVSAMHHDFHNVINDPVAWTALARPLADCRLALVTTAGAHLASDPPFDEFSPLGDPSFRVIPADTPGKEIVVHHNHYDHQGADRDINCILPVDRLRELDRAGVVRSASAHYGFMGFNPNPHPLLASAREVAQRLRDDGVDVAVLTPG